MGFIVISLLVGSAIATLFRTMALSPLSEKLIAHQIWVMDFGIRYGMLAIGIAFFVFLALKLGPSENFFILFAAWLVGLVAIWMLPPYLVTLFNS